MNNDTSTPTPEDDQTTSVEGLDGAICCASLFDVQCLDPFKGWDTWLTFDNEPDAIAEAERRQAEPNIYREMQWRVMPRVPDSLRNDKDLARRALDSE
jgi:hypothetical protein